MSKKLTCAEPALGASHILGFWELFKPIYMAAMLLDSAAYTVLADPTNKAALDYLREARAQYAKAEAAWDADEAAAKP